MKVGMVLKIHHLNKKRSDNRTANKTGLIRGHLPLEYTFGFFKTFQKVTKGLCNAPEIKTTTRKGNCLYTTLGDETVNVTVKN